MLVHQRVPALALFRLSKARVASSVVLQDLPVQETVPFSVLSTSERATIAPPLSNISTSRICVVVAPAFAVTRTRYCAYGRRLAKAYVFASPRAEKASA